MDQNQNAKLTVAFLCAILLAFTVADFWNQDRLYSEYENRVLASRPDFSIEALLDGSFTADYEEYVTDQFVSRDKWISLKTRGDILLRKKEINGIYLGRDGYLLEQHLPASYSAVLEAKKTALLNKLVQRYNARVMLVPTADNILTDKLPANAQYYDETRLLDSVRDAVGERRFVDVAAALKQHADEEIYYRTDHHWTSLGAYYGYLEWAEKAGKIPFRNNIPGMETVTDSFLGTLHSKINLPMEADTIKMFPETLNRPVSITYDFSRTTDSFYEEGYLDTKNKYGYFLDDNHGFVEINTDYHNAKTLFLIKDSYANCLVPLLAPHYETIYMVDLRYFNGSLFQLIDQYETERGMDVLVVYDCIHFLEDFQYY